MKRLALILIFILLLTALVSCEPRLPSTEVSVVFDSLGGSRIADAFTSEISVSPIPTKKGYAFEGWYETADFSGKIVEFPYMPVSNVTLYAKYVDLTEGNSEITYEYNPEGDCYEAVSYRGKSVNVVVPALYKGKKVKNVRLSFMKNLPYIRKFYIGKNLEKIDENFANCKFFEEYELIEPSEFFNVTDGILYGAGGELVSFPRAKKPEKGEFSIPDEVVTVCRNSLKNCSYIETVVLGRGVKNIEENFKSNDNLKKILSKSINFYSDNGVLYDGERKVLLCCPVTYGKELTLSAATETVVDGALNGCNLEMLTLNGGLISFGVQETLPFLKNVAVIDGVNYYAEDGVLYSKTDGLILYPASKDGEVFTVKGVKSIGKNSFAYAKNLKTLTVCAEVEKISQFAFFSSNIESIVFEQNSKLSQIDSTAFLDAENLKKVVLTAVTPPAFSEDAVVKFYIYVPEVSYELYLNSWEKHYLYIRKIVEENQ